MKPEDINRAIAEHCGWEFISALDERHGERPAVWKRPDGQQLVYYNSPLSPYPNYCEDYNALRPVIHTLESVAPNLGVPCRSLYLRHLTKLVGDYGWEMTEATAAQRAEAFLRTVGKWKD